MTQRRRAIPRNILYEGIAARMERFGIGVDIKRVALPTYAPSLVTGPDLGHLCFGDDEEYFPDGVPVFGSVTVTQRSGQRWQVSLPLCITPYWTNPILLLHDWAKPARTWRKLHFLEAVSLLTLNPGLGGVRYHSPNATAECAELYFLEGKIFVECGSTPRGHHMAYTQMSHIDVIERKVR